MSKTNKEMTKVERLKVEYERFSVEYDPDDEVFEVTYLGEYQALIQEELVRAIASETGKREELVAMILGTTKMIRNMTPGVPDKVDDQLIVASVGELLDAKISPLEITMQFFYHFKWCRIEQILKTPERAAQLFRKYRKPF